MRVLAAVLCALTLAGPAAAAGPSFGVFDLQHDLAGASRDTFGDVAVKPRTAVAGKGVLVRCAAWCRFGTGWVAFAVPPALTASDLSTASASFSKRLGWHVRVTLRPAAEARWHAFAVRVAAAGRRRGVPEVLVVVVRGQIAATPLYSQIAAAHGVLTLTGFSRASAKALASTLR